ncbi:uncharacterized protein LOC119349393 isoform X1 [Triticum dicoccoides]|uniref:uncharacterized protein LOC119349393 isoform X1 n=1 Tax=Triticum dicoccoides TaxID=85692 RepID=UPI000E7B2970|nr:uncharacterized protein LOC119349393 isoform X1 [Triticum dicoccoides]XP_037473318.1 uncharacterized protein LOC119349393 isoform X1 [Triticum dicoccoides]
MSDCATNRFNEKEDFQVVLGKGNPGESSCQQLTKWMAHWTRASSSPYGKSCSPLEDANNSTCAKDSETSPFELRKSTVAERLMSGRNHEGISMKNVPRLDPNMWGVAHDAWQEAEQTKTEWRDGHFQSCKIQMQKDENFYAKTVVSKTLSVCRLSDLPLDFQKLVSSDENPDSHWNQIPMLSVNQKVETILSPKRKYASGSVFDDLFVPQQIPKLNVGPSNLMACSHQEYGLQFPRMTDMVMDHCKPSGGIKHLLEDPTCLISDHAGKKLKVDNNSSSDCGMDEQGTGHYFANPNQEPLGRCDEKQFNLSENSDKFTDSVKQNDACLFEMLTIPSKPQSTYPVDSLSSCSPLFGAQNQLSCKTKTMHGDAQYVSKSSAGMASSSMQKDNICAEKANEQLATLSIEGSPRYNKANIFHNANANQYVSSKATTSSKQEPSSPGTETMDLDPLPFESGTRNQVPTDTIRSPAGADPSEKWLKRLLHDTANPHVHRSKRPRTGDCRPVRGAGGMSGTDIVDPVEARCVRCWIGRLCQGGGAPVSLGEPDERRTTAKPEVAAREFGGHFSSIKAMAMMGRMMRKIRPFDRERKGPWVMWKAEDGA